MTKNNTIRRLIEVDPRGIWRREDKDFTPWLAQNIDYLNDKLDFEIVVQTVEGNVGPYFVDIYGEDGAGNRIIIENQLEKSDHGHLGQILTYLVNLDANIAIWITTNPSEEHQQVVEWLNEITPDNMLFYLIQVKGVKVEGSDIVSPLFTIVEGPTQERKRIGAEKKEYAQRHTIRKQFWAQFINEMNKKSVLCQNISPSTDAWIGIALGTSGVSLNLVVSKNYARAEIYINKGDTEKNKQVFDYFYKHKEDLEKSFGDALTWERMDDRVTSRIKYQLDKVSVFNESDWPKMNEFMIDAAIRIHNVFRDHVQHLRNL
jgi:predicted Fe-Mo cluster-binding NifX family protein